ncbi:alpha/beta hydrolase [Hyphococcus sp. DH-69]|uniref:alpha/beta hydrolase n=1 Tax=Hyphococcus formosus TaxID=3143534 RepID=UPI00398A96A9
MASLRANFFNWYIKATFRSKPIHLMPPKSLREGAEKLAPEKPPAGITMELVQEPNIRGEWHRAVDAARGRTVFYMHGGGYVFGSPKSHRDATFALAKQARADVFSLDYRLAPENPFPAAVEDAVMAYEWLLGQGCDPETMVLGGDSAGGGLTLALLLSIKERNLPMPSGALLYSPWTDLAATGHSIKDNDASDAMFKAVYIVEGAKRYLGDADPKNPLASPLYGDLSGLPPILTFASKAEVLLDDSVRLHLRLEEASVDSTLILEDGLCHVWPIFPSRFPEAMMAVEKAASFISKQTGENTLK